MIVKYKHEIIIAVFLIVSIVVFYYLYGLILPFFIGLALAFGCLPLVKRIQRVVPNQALAVTTLLIGFGAILVLFLSFGVHLVVEDFERFNTSFHILAEENKEELDATEQQIRAYIGNVYDFSHFEKDAIQLSDSLSKNVNTESVSAAFGKIFSALSNNKEASSRPHYSFIGILFSSIGYFIIILYYIDYFVAIRANYFNGKMARNYQVVVDDFNQSFVQYFKLRTKIIALLSLLYLVAFLILDLPGTFLFVLLISLLSYIPYFQYLALIPIAMSCLVLSVETEEHFMLFYGIVIGVFILATMLEEMILYPMIIEENIGTNPVILMFGISIWTGLLGLQGTLLGIPLTILVIIYLKRFVFTSFEKVNALPGSIEEQE